MDAGGLDPTVINGGVIHAYGSNARAGAGEWMVVEADESDGSFNRLPATIAIVTNFDPEHMEHWGSFDALRKGFTDFVSNIPFYGLAVCCTDHPEVQVLVGRTTDRRVVTFGFNAQTEEYGDMFKFGVIDPAKVVRTALEDAASVAGLLITTEAMIAEAPKKESAPAMPGGGMGGMGGMM